MTAHELAAILLAGPDVPVWIETATYTNAQRVEAPERVAYGDADAYVIGDGG